MTRTLDGGRIQSDVRLNTHAGCIAAGVGRVFSRVCLSVCLFVRALKRKRLEYQHQTWHTYTL